MIDHCSLEEVKAALARAFNEGAPETGEFGGPPHDLLRMVLGRSPAQWADYISVITAMYIEHGCADKLGLIVYLPGGGSSWREKYPIALGGISAKERSVVPSLTPIDD